MRILTEKQYNALLNQAYVDGYHAGFRAAEREALYKQFTPNDIRKTFGFEPIKKED